MSTTTATRLVDLGLTSPDQLLEIAARSAGRPGMQRADLRISDVAYDLPSVTTRSRHRVHGTLHTGVEEVPVSIFVKTVQSFAHSPVFAFVPPEHRATALAQLPWRIEPLVYGTDLGRCLPDGLRMAEVYAVLDLEPEAAAIWMEDVDWVDRPWGQQDYAHAANLLGQFAASPQVRTALEPIREQVEAHRVRDYVEGRVTLQVVPALRDPATWAHPMVQRHFSGCRAGMLDLTERLPDLLAELETLPTGVCHGDACTRNLLATADGTLVMIDFGFLRYAPLGLDLAQLVLGEIQLGERPVDDLTELWALCSAAYAEGVRRTGDPATPAQIERAAALSVAIFAGVSAIPVELLDEAADERPEIFANRAVVARFILDLVESNGG